jgi:small conductance mechanosensitive channel
VLRDNDGAIHFIPNGNIARAANQTLDYAKVNIEISLPLAADLDTTEKAINALGTAMGKEDVWNHTFIQAPFYHGVQKFDKEAITIEVRAKTIPAEQWRVSSELQKRLAALVVNHNDFTKEKPRASKKH